MTNKLSTRFKKFAMGALVAALGASAVVIAAVTFSDFTTGTTISASEMNTKLNALKNAVNAASKTDQAYFTVTGGGGALPLTGSAQEVVGLDFTCPADGFVVATSSTHITITTLLSIAQLQTRTSQTSPSSLEPGFAFATGIGNSTVSTVRRFSCSNGVLVRYSVMAREAIVGATTSDASYSTLVLHYSPL
jgi:hypothetical protein